MIVHTCSVDLHIVVNFRFSRNAGADHERKQETEALAEGGSQPHVESAEGAQLAQTDSATATLCHL